jgi:hypothetical protein
VPNRLDTFLQLLAGSNPGERLLEVRYRPPDAEAGMWRRFFPARNPRAAAEFIAWQGARSDTYVGVLLRDRPRGVLAQERPRGGRDAVSRSHLLFVDIDREDAVECLDRAPVPPSALVSSGTRGHVHAYFQLAAAITPAELEAGNRKLAGLIGGDLRSVDAARTLRAPSTHNFKHTPPAPATLEVADLSRVYSYDFLVGGLSDPQPKPPPAPPRRELAQVPGGVDGVDGQLRTIATAEYIARFTGREPNREGKVLCPFHEERTPSLHAYPDGSWACFGCGKGGTIYDFAGYVFGLQTKGPAFLELRERLAETFGLEEPPRQRGARRPRPPMPVPSRVVLARPGADMERGIER